tara:strand:- start:275 stop:1204 length:930 start_codon:yes stop_codon:yes gene_type:complete
MKFSLTLILSSLVLFSSCSSIPNQDNAKPKLQLNIQTSNKNKEIIIEALLKDNVTFSVNFNDEDSYILKDDVLNSNLKYFCNSFLDDQRKILEKRIFNSTINKGKKVLVIYSNSFKGIYSNLVEKYPEHEYLFVDDVNYELQIKEVLNVDSSFDKYLQISRLYEGGEILHSPRIRNDIGIIYFLTNYEFGKTIVPIFRSYALGIDFYASTEIFHEANDIKKLVDFENTYIPVTTELISDISIKETSSIKEEIENILIKDLIDIEKIYQNNQFREKIIPTSGNSRVQRSGCINRDLTFWEVTTLNIIDQT